MCGIFAWWPAHPAPLHADRVQAALRALGPRGPDGQGLWSDPQGTAHLGHTRLAITGTRGVQPLWNADRTVAILVNGEFYGADDQRRAWRAKGHRFSSDSDSELLLPLYAAHGTGALSHLEGEFAFVLWDRRRQRVWMARDRAGVKPLRVALGPEGLAAASEAKALIAAGWRARWDEDALAQHLALQYPEPSRTFFEGIGQLEPGESRTYDLAPSGTWHCQSRRWWRWFPHASDDLKTPTDAAEELSSALTAAVARRLDTPWPVAVHLSGGLDSSAILALARAQRAEGITAFSVAFDRVPGAVVHDESLLAQATAHSLGVPWVPVHAGAQAQLAHWGEAVARAEMPGINGHLVAKWLLAKAVHEQGFRVSLTGEGADEALLGYAFLAADAQAAGVPLDARRLWDANPVALGSMLPDGAGLDLAAIRDVWGWVPTWVAAKAVRGARLAELMTHEWRQERLPAAVRSWAEHEAPGSGVHPVHQSAAAWARRALGGYILPALADAPEAGFAIEGRLPFLDAGVLTATAGWSPSATGWPHTPKQPLRALLARWGLTEVASRPKHPFEAPPLWSSLSVRAALRARWADPERWRRTPFDTARVVAWMDRLDGGTPADHQQAESVVATLLSLDHLSVAYGLELPQ